MINSVYGELKKIVGFVICSLPGGLGCYLRNYSLRRKLKSLGSNAIFESGLLIIGAQNISIGSNFSCWRYCTIAACDDGAIKIGNRVAFNANVYINACSGGRIVIEDDVLVAPNVVMRTNNHITSDREIPISQQGDISGEIIIENDVWIGANATIVGGVCIGQGAVVGAGAVVTRNVDQYTIVGGVPARFIKMRGE